MYRSVYRALVQDITPLMERNSIQQQPSTDMPAYSDTAYSDTPLIVTL